MTVRAVPLCRDAAQDTIGRLGPPPPVDGFGWYSWVEEAAATFCARSRRGDPDHGQSPPCKPCRTIMRAYLRHLAHLICPTPDVPDQAVSPLRLPSVASTTTEGVGQQ